MDFNPTQRIRKMQLAIEQEAKERRDQILANAEQTYLGLIKLMEEEVELQCNKDDVELVESTLAAAQKQFEELVLKECNKTLKTKVTVNKTQYLDSGDFKYTGGIILSCLEGRIKFINTLDARIDLACSELLPQIRDGLFPNLATEMNQQLVKPQKVQEAHK